MLTADDFDAVGLTRADFEAYLDLVVSVRNRQIAPEQEEEIEEKVRSLALEEVRSLASSYGSLT